MADLRVSLPSEDPLTTLTGRLAAGEQQHHVLAVLHTAGQTLGVNLKSVPP